MKIFIIKIISFSILIFSLAFLLGANISKSEEEDYVMGGIVLKHKRLDSLQSNRVIFAGGSNLAFGIDSKRIEDSIKMPVVNMSIHISLGLNFMLNEIRLNAKPGDIVFLSPEYFVGDGRYELKEAAAAAYPPASQYYNHSFYTDLINLYETKSYQIKNNRIFVTQLINERISHVKRETSVYSRTSFNQYGDVIAHLNHPPPPTLNARTIFKYEYWDGIDKINTLAQELQKKGVHLYFLYPTYARKSYGQNKDVIKRYQADLSKNLIIPIINTPEDFVYDDDQFYDTVYHLKAAAREKRTNRLIELIHQHTNL